MFQVRALAAAVAMAVMLACTSAFLTASRALPSRVRTAAAGIRTLSMTVPLITPQDAYEMMKSKSVPYVDVRTQEEFSQGHPEGSSNIPAFFPGPTGMAPNTEFVSQVEQTYPKEEPLIVGCQAGPRSTKAVGMLEAAGYSNLMNVEGGYGAWARDENLPVSR
eukprot:TRINITY_DN793_c0_g1_i1.p1 TRINITY_DN793_c0_g1~~TRINITY_DN793_c0_g1_i1.p1  ORF type:complete len:163 (-),score=27.01 TRINITY_DN793_c0_g1_i1:136-624(-)